jgi:hypothetical protein
LRRASLLTVDVRCLARDERADFAAFLAALPPGQWGGAVTVRWVAGA